MDNRRQSGLWAQNPATGYYKQQQPATSAIQGPYQYYQAPPHRSTDDKQRRSYSERVGNADDAFIASGQSSASKTADSAKIRELTKAASERIAGMHDYGQGTTSADLAGVKHVNEVPSSAAKGPLSVDPDAVPENLRTKAWSPDPNSPRTATKQEEPLKSRQTSGASEPVRRSSVSNRSPLQKLEGKLDDISKEEKRARAEEAEQRARKKSLGRTGLPTEGELLRTGTLRTEKPRVVGDPSVGRSRIEQTPGYRQVSAGAPQAMPPEDGVWRFRRTSEALTEAQRQGQANYIPSRERSMRQQQTAPIANEPGPYHHAPEISRSLSQRQKQKAPIANEPRPYHHTPEILRSLSQRQPGARPIEQQARPYHHAPEEPRSLHARQATAGSTSGDGVNRSASGKYKHRVRDAGFAGAAAAVAGAGVVSYEASANRGKEAYERRKSQEKSPVSPKFAESANGGGVGRSGSRKLQKRYPENIEKQQLQTDSMGSSKRRDQEPEKTDPVSRSRVATGPTDPVPYKIPPQTAAGQEARERVGFDEERIEPPVSTQDQRDRIGRGLYSDGQQDRAPQAQSQRNAEPLNDWRGAQVVRLTLEDLDFSKYAEPSTDVGADNAWWEKDRSKRSSGSSRQPGVSAAQYDGPYEEEAKLFRPPLFLKCGPLLRYTGIRREYQQGRAVKEIWRGSVMIVTEDPQSDLSSEPTLRLFAQPMDLHQPPSRQMLESGQEIPPEHEDPVAGQVKVSRTGRPLYVRPVHDIEGGIDLSREEHNQGLYTATRTPILGPQFSGGQDGRQSQHITFQDKSRIKRRDGEKAGRYREIKALRLRTERGFTFWRWSIEIELGSAQHRVAYRINKGPALGFWVPARGESMNIMFHSCNGFSLSVDPNQFSGPDPLWRDVLNKHQSRPFHVMIGGGDQLYNDAAMRDTVLFREWLQVKNPEHKHNADFSPMMRDELESFYLDRYSMWFSQGLFAMANSQIPMVNIWDDHDIIDGFGSYPHHFMASKVFAGLGAIAFKYYMLFQHQSLAAETEREEPSWILGASPGPYINELSRSVFLNLGHKVAFLGLDCRTERMRNLILSEESYHFVFDRCEQEIRKGETKHLIVLLGVPIAYPRLNFLENILTSKVMDPIKAIGRTGMLGGFVNKFDGGVEILDDLDDHWTAKHHKAERNWFIQELQELAAEKSVRVTILGGDVHLGAVGQFYTPRKFGVPKDHDHRYMPNVISSAIVNTPPPPMMADVLNRRNKVHHLDSETDEDLIPMFDTDVDGSKRNNKCLLPRRNYCTIREFAPGSTPPPTPPPERSVPGTPGSATFDGAEGYEREVRDRRFPPGSMGRTMSLTRGPANLIRRLSGSSRSNNPPVPLQGGAAPGMGRSNSMSGPRPSFDTGDDGPPVRPINTFHRRPTNLSEKEIRGAASKGGAPEDEDADAREPGHIDLENGLDISLNMEIDQRDPGGATQGYRLLIPALWYEGAADVNNARFKSRGASFMDRFRGKGGRKRETEDEGEYSDEDGSPTVSPPPNRGQPFAGQPPAVGGAPVQTQKPPYGADAAYNETRNGATAPRQSMDQSGGAAYNKGYNLSSPPLGANAQTQPPPTNNPYPSQQQPASRRTSAPVSQKHTQSVPGPYGRGPDEYSEGSLTPSEDDLDEGPPGRTPGVQPRRLSKAERFFGIGDEGGPARRESQSGGGYVDATPGKTKPKWMIWR